MYKKIIHSCSQAWSSQLYVYAKTHTMHINTKISVLLEIKLQYIFIYSYIVEIAKWNLECQVSKFTNCELCRSS